MSKYGVVLVSHVPELVVGLHRLLKEIAKAVPITIAGGLEDETVGTSFAKIQQAIDENPADALLVFYDLGSAKMNLEMVQELVDRQITIYDVAFVEGSYTATALLEAGADFQAITEQLSALKIK